MYNNNILNNTLNAIATSEGIFVSEWDKYTTLQSIRLIFNKFNLDTFIDEYEFNDSEYRQYFKNFVKYKNIDVHHHIKQEFKERGQ